MSITNVAKKLVNSLKTFFSTEKATVQQVSTAPHTSTIDQYRNNVRSINNMNTYLNIEESNRYFNAWEEGLNDGPEGEPADDAVGVFTRFDKQVIHHYKKTIEKLHAITSDFITSLVESIRNDTPQAREKKFNQLVADTKSALDKDFEAAYQQGEMELRELESEMIKQQSYLMYFRERNQLNFRDAYLPGSLVSIGIFFITLILLESIFNSVFFVEMQANGQIGGLLISLGTSIANVSFSVFLGYFSRYTKVPNRMMKTLGYVALGGFVLFALGLNAFVALSRLGDMNSSLEELFTPLLQLANIGLPRFMESVILLVLGLVIGGLSFRKGYCGLSDPYPEFTKMTLNALQAKQAYQDKVTGFKRALEQIKEQCLQPVTSQYVDIKARYGQTQSKLETYEQICTEELKVAQSMIDACCGVLEEYRRANLKTRVYAPETLRVVPVEDLTTEMAIERGDGQEIYNYVEECDEVFQNILELYEQLKSEVNDQEQELLTRWQRLCGEVDSSERLKFALSSSPNEVAMFEKMPQKEGELHGH
ncbi:hypothetical protein [Vibrio sp. WXL210]|uniref:hypothetical protein n=1 Tax=Vibrio sp. WXL210 TaxID=3450709 RepID=UPI003EC71B4E